MTTTNQWRTDPNTGSTIDSFETNLRQIEHTNKLLYNIENKLNSFFQRNPTTHHHQHHHISPRQTRHTDERDQILHDQQASLPSREDYIPNIGNTLLSPIQDKDSIQQFLSMENDPNIKGLNKYIHIVDGAKTHERHTDQDSSPFSQRHRDPVLVYNPNAQDERYEYPFHEVKHASPHKLTANKNYQINTRRGSEDMTKGKTESISKKPKSPGTAYEEFEEELKRVKGIVSNRLAMKKAKKQGSVSEKEIKSRRSSQDTGRQKEKVETKMPSTARGVQRSSPGPASLKSSTNSRMKSSRKY